MKVLVLSKRYYTGKDLINDRYGRLYELPALLAEDGIQVKGLCLSYRRGGPANQDKIWRSIDPALFFPLNLLRYFVVLISTLYTWKPDVLWACSDSFHGIWGLWIGRLFGCKVVIDFYDNFESFGASQIPGVTRALRHASRHADALTVVSAPLQGLIRDDYQSAVPVLVLENATTKNGFYPKDKHQCRTTFSLPGKTLIGTAGAISHNRGITDLLIAHQQLLTEYDDIWLVLAGRKDKGIEIDAAKNQIYLGELDYSQMNEFYNCLDVAIICNRDSDFGNYCFPQKYLEILGSGVPVVAAAVGVMKQKLAEFPASLYQPGRPETLAKSIKKQLAHPDELNQQTESWDVRAKQLRSFLQRVV